MQTNQKQIWFPAKKYGWGWGLPCSWQGWAAFAVLLVLGLGSAALLLPGGHLGLWIVLSVVLVVAAFILCLVKGERPRWRWGKD
jgi:hypothetical protein